MDYRNILSFFRRSHKKRKDSNCGQDARYVAQIQEKILNQNETAIEIPENEQSELVSIIITNHDGMHVIPTLFDSLKCCKFYRNYEIIFVDNASKDNSVEYVERYKESMPIKIISNLNNETFSKANNIAAEVAQGKYLLFLNNDVEVTDFWIDGLIDLIRKVPECGAVGSKLLYPRKSDGDNISGKDYRIQHAGIKFRLAELDGTSYYKPYNFGNGENAFDSEYSEITEYYAVTAACLLVKKEDFFHVGGFDEDYNYGFEDVDLCLKLHKCGLHNMYCPYSILFHHEFGTQKTQDVKEVRIRRHRNAVIFKQKWNNYLKFKLSDVKLIRNERKICINICAPSRLNSITWGDYYYASSLKKCFERRGYECELRCKDEWYNPFDGKYVIMLRGISKYVVDCTYTNIMWNISHPSDVTFSEYNSFDIVYVASIQWADYLSSVLVTVVKPLLQCTDLDIFNKHECTDPVDVLFVGMNRNPIRPIIGDLAHPIEYNLKIYGPGWKCVIDKIHYGGNWIKNDKLSEYYSNAKIVLNDHWGDMKSCGFINNRIFDAVASGAFVVSDYVDDIVGLFDGNVITYSDSADLNMKISYYLKNNELRNKMADNAMEIVRLNHTFEQRVETIIQNFDSLKP